MATVLEIPFCRMLDVLMEVKCPTADGREPEKEELIKAAAENTRGGVDALECHVRVHALQTFRMMDRSSLRRTGKNCFRRSCRASEKALLMLLKVGRRKTQNQMAHSLACLSLLGMTFRDPGCAHSTITACHLSESLLPDQAAILQRASAKAQGLHIYGHRCERSCGWHASCL